MVQVVTLNENNRVELTVEELKQMLEAAKEEGRNEAYAFYNRPWITTTTPTVSPDLTKDICWTDKVTTALL